MTVGLSEQADRQNLNEAARSAAAGLVRHAITPRIVSGVIQFVDFVILAAIGAAISFLVATADAPAWRMREILMIVAVPLIATSTIRLFRLYEVQALRDYIATLARILPIWMLSIAAAAAVAFLYGANGSRRWLVEMLVIGTLFFILSRAILANIVASWRRSGRLERRAVIVGGGAEAAELVAALSSQTDSGIRLCGLFDDRTGDRSPDELGGLPKLGTIAELVEFARLASVDLLIVSLPATAEQRLLQLLKQLWVLPVDIRLSALGSKIRLTPRSYSYIGPVPFLDLFDRPVAGWSSVVKRGFDILFASIALLLLSPLIAGTALAIRLDSPGPLLFRQKRYGFNNEVIEVFKFRSMYHHMRDPLARVSVTRDDPRVTRVGRFIRRTSLDELPQLWNVLRGELSLVGPRPHAVNAHTANRLWDEVVDGYFARHKVKPGITGWAQVNGWRGEVDTPEKIQRRVEYDLDYIERWSVLFDLYILAITPLSLIHSENAY